MSNRNYENVLEQCKELVKEFERCGLVEDVKRRIFELVQEWERRKADSEKEGKQIGGLRVIFYDMMRAVGKAEADSKKYGKDKCEYFRRWLSRSFTEKGGLGYWSLQMWQ